MDGRSIAKMTWIVKNQCCKFLNLSVSLVFSSKYHFSISDSDQNSRLLISLTIRKNYFPPNHFLTSGNILPAGNLLSRSNTHFRFR